MINVSMRDQKKTYSGGMAGWWYLGRKGSPDSFSNM